MNCGVVMGSNLEVAAKLIQGVLLRQPFMQLIGVTLGEVVEPRRAARRTEAGAAPAWRRRSWRRDRRAGRHAAGAAAGTLTLPDKATVTAEYKISFIAPGAGDSVRALGQVLKAGKTLIKAESRVYAVKPDGSETLCAVALATLVPVALPGK
jgi:hypothetical protein